MIGLKIKNSFWEKALLDLLKERAESWRKNKMYSVVLTDLQKDELMSFQNQISSPLIGIGNHLKRSVTLPCTKEELENILFQSIYYENKTFIWDSLHRQLKNKRSGKIISLTEKEALLVDCLTQNPQKEASKEELLKKVWNYTETTETHTIETTVYTLNKKLGKKQLIKQSKTGFKLI